MQNSSASSESALADLVSLWQRRRAEGQTVTPDELCRDRPDLLSKLEQRIAVLEWMTESGDAMHETATLDPAAASHAAPDLAAAKQGALPTLDYLAPTCEPVPTNWPKIPGYEIVGELGRGGMGVVYKARQTQLGRMVALKMILSGGMAGQDELARFRTEAEAIARLQHANIVQIHEVGEHEGRPFFSLEFCAGGSLADKLNGTPLPADEAARLVETLAQAMKAAHQAHVIHRDLKPANVLLTADGTPRISDFGLAKKLDVPGQTYTGAVMGTPSYMAPEQASGEKDVGTAADVYALGAILYELLTGRPPFKAATTLDTILQVKYDEPVPPRQLQSKVPRDLETICLKCLQKKPSARYARALDLAEDLRRFRAGEPIRTRPPGPLERSWKLACRHPGWATALVVFAAGFVVSAVLASVAKQEATRAEQQAEWAKQEASRAARAMSELALLYGQHKQFPVARRYSAESVAIARRLSAASPGEIDSRECLAICLSNEGELARESGDVAGSLASFREALVLYEGLARQVPSHLEYPWCWAMAEMNLASALAAGPRRDWAEAEKLLRHADERYQGLTKANPGNQELQVYLKENRERLHQIEQKRKASR
jgi:hypothetical protein